MAADSELLDGVDLEMENLKKLISSYEKARNEGSAPSNLMLEDLLCAMRSEESISEATLQVPGSSDEPNAAKVQEIIPEPCYFVKLWGMEGQKYFVNMCGSPKIAAPGEWKSGVPPELEESLSHMETHPEYGNHINLRFSLSCSDYTLWKDKSGKICKVFDVVFNADVMRQSIVNKQLKHFLINMAMSWISQKHGIELKSDFKIPKGTYMGGTIRKQFIRADKVKLVTEINCEDSQPSFPLLISESRPSETHNLHPLKENDELRTTNCLESSETNLGDESTVNFFNPLKENDELRTEKCLESRETNLGDEHKMHDIRISEASNTKSEGLDIFSLPHQDFESRLPAGSDVKRIPEIHVKYVGSPVELVILCLSLPFPVDVDKSKVYISNTMLYLDIFQHDPVEAAGVGSIIFYLEILILLSMFCGIVGLSLTLSKYTS